MPTRTAEARRQALEARESGAAGVLLDPTFLLELLDERAEREAERIRARAGSVRARLGSPIPTRSTTNHAIREGVALCGLKGTPLDWPPGNAWVYAGQAEAQHLVNCLGCATALKLERRR